MIFSIVTPSLDRADFLDEAIASVVGQQGDFGIDYVVQDGGSGPDVLAVLERWRRRIDDGSFAPRCRQVRFRYFVEKDSGMYDALARGFARTTGDVMAWLNTDDFYLPSAFATVAAICAQYPSVHWLTGIGSLCNLHGTIIASDEMPPVYSRDLLLAGLYSERYRHLGLGPVPQESTFWRRGLWEQAGAAFDVSRRLAGDFVLWQRFAAVTDLVKVHARLAAFRFHGRQLTAHQQSYLSELPPVAGAGSFLPILRTALTLAPPLRRLLLDLPDVKALARLRAQVSRVFGRGLVWCHETKSWQPFWDLAI